MKKLYMQKSKDGFENILNFNSFDDKFKLSGIMPTFKRNLKKSNIELFSFETFMTWFLADILSQGYDMYCL